jgi:hypothetical protein
MRRATAMMPKIAVSMVYEVRRVGKGGGALPQRTFSQKYAKAAARMKKPTERRMKAVSLTGGPPGWLLSDSLHPGRERSGLFSRRRK